MGQGVHREPGMESGMPNHQFKVNWVSGGV